MKCPKNAWWNFVGDGRFKKPKGFWKRYLRKWLLKHELQDRREA